MLNCPRCNGLIDRDYMPSETEYTLMRPCFGCINCGWRNDLVYNLNRMTQKKEAQHA